MRDYLVHGLVLRSEIVLPGACPFEGGAEVPDVTVRIQVIADGAYGVRTAEGFIVCSGGILLSIQDVAKYWIEGGHTIVVSPCPNADEGALQLYLLGSALGACLHQRSVFPIHASAAVLSGSCIAFLGDSGQGKSTLVASLMGRGHRICSDDVIVPIQDRERFTVAPSVPSLKLWPQSMMKLGLVSLPTAVDTPDSSKLRIGAPSGFAQERFPLRCLYILRWMLPKSAPAEIVEVPAFQSLIILRRNIYRLSLLEALQADPAFMAFASALLSSVRCFEFRRAMDFSKVSEQVSLLEEHVARLNGFDTSSTRC